MDNSTKMGEEIVKMLSKSTLDLLRCNKCKNYLSSPTVYSFEDGTNLCESCYDKESDDFKKIKHIRNGLYMLAVGELEFPCQYSNDGCPETIRFGERQNEFCMYRCFECPVADDGFRGTVRHILDHLRTQHQNMWFNGNEILFTIAKEIRSSSIDIRLIQPHGNFFTIHEGEPFKELKIIFHTGERVFIIVIGVCYVYSRWQLKVLVNEITHKECTGIYTVSFKQEPYLSVIRKHKIGAYEARSIFTGFVQDLTYLFLMRRRLDIITCKICIDISDPKEETTHNDK